MSQFPYVGMPVIFWPKAVDKLERDEIWPLAATVVGLNSESVPATDEFDEYQKILSVNIAGYDRIGKPFDRQEVQFASGDDGDLEDGFCQANSGIPQVASRQDDGGKLEGSKFTMRDVENNLKTLFANFRNLDATSNNQTTAILELKKVIDEMRATSATVAAEAVECDPAPTGEAKTERDDL